MPASDRCLDELCAARTASPSSKKRPGDRVKHTARYALLGLLVGSGAKPSPSLALALFYGRDDRARLIGARAGKSGPEGVYLRWLPAGFKREKAEIGRLSDPRGALVAVLGTADPEIVCRPGEVCLVKRRSGWSSVKAPPDLQRVVLGGDVGWAVAGQTLLRLGDDDWHPAGPPGAWKTADALFATREKA